MTLSFLKNYIIFHPPIVPLIHQIPWYPPLYSWIKGNSDGASQRHRGPEACGGIFRDHRGKAFGSLCFNNGTRNAYIVKLWGATLAIETAWQKGWIRFWLETNSTLVIQSLPNLLLSPRSSRIVGSISFFLPLSGCEPLSF